MESKTIIHSVVREGNGITIQMTVTGDTVDLSQLKEDIDVVLRSRRPQYHRGISGHEAQRFRIESEHDSIHRQSLGVN